MEISVKHNKEGQKYPKEWFPERFFERK